MTKARTTVDDRFDAAVGVVLAHEGGFVDDPADPGAATNWGISLKTLAALGDLDGDGYRDGDRDRDGDVDADDVRALERGDAIAIYRRQWWDRYGYDRVDRLFIATKLFDLAVNMGPRQAHLIVQRALRATDQPVAEDGILGPETLAAINNAPAFELMSAMRSEAAGFYRALIAKRPKLARFERGWLSRAYS